MVRIGRLLAVSSLCAACGAHTPDAIPPAPPETPAVAGPAAAPAPDPRCEALVHPAPRVVPDAGVDESAYGPSRHEKPEHARDLCEPADTNLELAEGAILAGRPAATAPAQAKPWDGKSSPKGLEAVARRLGLSPEEKGLLGKNGFVVLPRLSMSGYAWAYHEIFQSQLPVFVSLDSVFHAVYAAHDHLLEDVERQLLLPRMGGILDRMHCALPDAGYPAEAARDLDVYLMVARSLLYDQPVASRLGDPRATAEAAALVTKAHAAQAMEVVDLFGRKRVVDFTQFLPRGHYAGADNGLEPYFRAVMWLSRLEFNLVSRSSRSSAPGEVPDPSETPREEVAALALADLARRAGVLEELGRVERTFTVFAGRREDVSVPELLELARKAGIRLDASDAPDKLRAAIGDGWKRTARVHYMPQGSKELPAIATLLGPRIVADVAAMRPIVHGEVPGRHRIGAADAAYLMGDARARTWLAADLAAFPDLEAQLDKARKLVEDAPRGDDLYVAWLDAIRALSLHPEGALPTFTHTSAYEALRFDTIVAAYAQLKHNHVLLVGQGYDEGGCEIPDGYVEPSPAAYAALVRYAQRGAAAMKALDPEDAAHGQAYFARLTRVLRVLEAIQRMEIEGRALPVEAQRFLSMVVEMTPMTTGSPATYTGWWFDLFEHRVEDGLEPADLVADVLTSSEGGISYLGLDAPRLGIFVVDTGGPPRVVVGPVARAWEHHGDLAKRLDDEAARHLPAEAKLDPWARGYATAPVVEPALSVSYTAGFDSDAKDSKDDVIVVEAAEALGPVTIETLDHHRVATATQTRPVGKGQTRFVFRRGKKEVEGVHVRAGSFQGWGEVDLACQCVSMAYGSFRRGDEP